MGLENITSGAASTIADLDASNPTSGDGLGQADDHLRNIKHSLHLTFPNVSATVSGVASELAFAHKGGTVSGSAVILGGVDIAGSLTVSATSVFKTKIITVGLQCSATMTAIVTNAINANHAGSASYALSAAVAQSAVHAVNADIAQSASHAVLADTALAATYATSAGRAASASYALSALHAISANYAASAGFAASANFVLSANNAKLLNSISASAYCLVSERGVFANNANGNPQKSDTSIALTSVAAESAWESVGPTGSGADNIWTVLDSVPTDVDWIEVYAYLLGVEISGTANTPRSIQLFVRKNGSTEVASATKNIFGAATAYTSAAGNGRADAPICRKIPVSSVMFDIWWECSFATAPGVTLWLTGYGYNGG